SLRMQESLIFGQRLLFIFSSFVSSTTLFCLVKKTPQNQLRLRNYLIIIQVVSITATSVYMDVLFEPVPLFPILGGYCVGLLCSLGVSPKTLVYLFVQVPFLQVRLRLLTYRFQVAIPFSLLFFPAYILFISIICDCIPYSITLPAYFTLLLHPLVHNLMMLFGTPTYRQWIKSHFR
ncbi:hypothetical protein PFISCL1PPCAC_3258, partial [Pristionchus fissidentatus]